MIELLTEVGLKHPDIITEPSPDALFIGFGDSALNFQLRAWTSNFKRWQVIRSELTLGIHAALRAAQISIPFPQRDLHIRSSAVESGLPKADKQVQSYQSILDSNSGDTKNSKVRRTTNQSAGFNHATGIGTDAVCGVWLASKGQARTMTN